MTSDQPQDSGESHRTSEQDHMITEGHVISGVQDHVMTENHGKDHLISEQDHMTNEVEGQVTSEDSIVSDKDQLPSEQAKRQDHVMPDVSNNTMYYEAMSHTSLHSNSGGVTDGVNTYDVQKELDEILSNSDLVDERTHSTSFTTDTTTAVTVDTTSKVVMDTSAVIMDTDTSTSLTKLGHSQSSPSTNSKSDTKHLPSNSPMSDSVKLIIVVH